tara:strand:- start:87 stop:1652 length:1566 start_codon:yes stop_codon:yes gene_type:complete
MQSNKFLKFLPIVLFFITVTIPMLSLQKDMWDGVIIEYASLIKNFSGLKIWFTEGTWFLQYPLSLFLIKVSEIINISYKNINSIFTFLLMAIYLREIFLFANNKLNLQVNSSLLILFSIVTFSTWGSLLSSVMTFHFFCMVLGIYSIRMIHSKKYSKKILGFLFFSCSLNFQSQLIYLPVLSYIYDLNKKFKNENFKIIFPSIETCISLVLGLVIFFIISNFYPPHGLYENSYSLNFSCIHCVIVNGLIMTTYLIPVFFVFVFINFSDFLLNKNNHSFKQDGKKSAKILLISLLTLFFVAVIPYVILNKYSFLWSLRDWGNRHAFLLALPVSLISGMLFEKYYNNSKNFLLKKISFTLFTVIILFQISLLIYSISFKLNRQIFMTNLETLIIKNQKQIMPGLLQIIGSDIPKPQIRHYESNFLMFSATGKANWWTRVSNKEDKNFFIPCEIRVNDAYQKEYIFDFELDYIKNQTIVFIEVNGYTSKLDVLKNILRLKNSKQIKIISIKNNFNYSNENYKCS